MTSALSKKTLTVLAGEGLRAEVASAQSLQTLVLMRKRRRIETETTRASGMGKDIFISIRLRDI
jgi:hypothetical protein